MTKVVQLSRKFPHSQEPATCPYSEPDQSSPCTHLTSWRSVLILSSMGPLKYWIHP